MQFIYSIPALAILLSLTEAGPIAMPEIFKRDLDLTLSAAPADCPATNALVSCSAGSSSGPSCCVEQEGLLLQTQFWDTDVSNSPASSWTIHGIWPDKCDGSYSSNCGFSSNIGSVGDVLNKAGETDLANYIEEYWVNNSGSNDELHTHEFNKHGTCFSTIGSSCYSSSSSSNPEQNVVDFVKLAVKTYQTLPTYDWLQEAGIVPSKTKTYKAQDIQNALAAKFGKQVHIGCKNHVLNEVWYFHTVQGSLLNDDLIKIDSVTSSTCSGSVKYLPKSQN